MNTNCSGHYGEVQAYGGFGRRDGLREDDAIVRPRLDLASNKFGYHARFGGSLTERTSGDGDVIYSAARNALALDSARNETLVRLHSKFTAKL